MMQLCVQGTRAAVYSGARTAAGGSAARLCTGMMDPGWMKHCSRVHNCRQLSLTVCKMVLAQPFLFPPNPSGFENHFSLLIIAHHSAHSGRGFYTAGKWRLPAEELWENLYRL